MSYSLCPEIIALLGFKIFPKLRAKWHKIQCPAGGGRDKRNN
jgi:hypothetical protein